MSTQAGAPGSDDFGFGEPHQFQSQAGLTDFGEPSQPAASQEPPATEAQAPGQQQPTAAPAGPQSQPTPQPQPSGQLGQPTLEQYMTDNGLKPEQVMSALQEYQFLASPEGQQHFQTTVEQRVTERLQTQRNDIVKQGVREILGSDEGRYAMHQALVRAGGVPGMQQQNEPGMEGQQQQHQAPPPWAQQLQRENATLKSQLQQITQAITGQQEQQGQLNVQQQQATEFDSFMQANPEAMAIQDVIAKDVLDRVRARPQMYERPGAIAYEARAAFQRYRTSATRLGAPTHVPSAGPTGSNTGGGNIPRIAAPRGEGDLIRSVLADIDSYQGGGR